MRSLFVILDLNFNNAFISWNSTIVKFQVENLQNYAFVTIIPGTLILALQRVYLSVFVLNLSRSLPCRQQRSVWRLWITSMYRIIILTTIFNTLLCPGELLKWVHTQIK